MNKNIKATVLVAALSVSMLFSSTISSAAKYKVSETDSLYKISVLFKTPVNQIKEKNNLSSSSIYPGQVLNISAKSYTIKEGDTLYKIAKKYKITVGAIRKANNKWDNQLTAGKKLVLPGVKPTSTTSSSTTVTKESTSTSTTKPVISYTNAELDLLARLITAEATGQPYQAKVAVGAVVVNRVQSKDWPSTINGVINHVSGGYYQFSPVKNGYINNPASDSALKAAKEALYGSDPSKGAMFYFDDSTTNQWLWSKPILARYGKMVFVK